MANQIKDNGIYVFDQDHVDTGTMEKNSPATAVQSFFTSRFAVFGMILCSIGIVILVMTASLQFSNISNNILTSSEGVSRQYTVTAPRGNITDCNGVMLASTEEVNTLLIADAKMDAEKKDDANLNAMLLDLSYLFDQYNVVPVADLTNYLTIDPYAFQKTPDEITAWQVSSNLFALKESTSDSVVTFTDDYVKSDPQIFFLYLRDKFHVDKSYTAQEAYRIILIRYQILADNWAYTTGTPIKIATDVPQELINKLLEQNFKYMGVIAGKEYRRVYSPQSEISSHVIGYVGKISQEKFAILTNMGYSLDDIIGQIGMEYQMERYLHGQSGTKAYNIWTSDQDTGAFFPENIGTDPVPGANVTLTIDTRLQKVAMDALKDYIATAKVAEQKNPVDEQYATASAGAVVMLDVKTGGILTMISYPNFDPSDFVLAMEGDAQAKEQIKYYLGLGDYKAQTEADKPLWNRAIQAQYAPGSTFKMVTAVAALETGKITPDSSTRTCSSPITIGDWLWRCHEFPEGGHGPLTLQRALATSCNIYFQLLGVETGIDAIDKWGQTLGLGELTGVDLPGEIVGIRASRETKRLLREKIEDKTWFPADTAQSSIGQFDNCFTILQLARYTAALATNTLVTPHVIKNVTAEDGTILYSGSAEVTQLNISQSTLAVIREGMKAVITDTQGTAKDLLGFPIILACKTGTAETGFEYIRKEYSNGLFVCYAPADDPQVALAIVVEKGEWGSSTSVIAEKLLLAYFNVPDPKNESLVTSDATIGDVLEVTATPAPGSQTGTDSSVTVTPAA